jgi:PAS domain S-box-containing protein
MPDPEIKNIDGLRSWRLKPKFLILTALLLAVIFLLIIVIGIRENQNNMLRMLQREGTALMESIYISSQNTIRATDLVDNIVTENLVDAATLADLEYSKTKMTSEELNQICQLLGFNRIDIIDSAGIILVSNYTNMIGQEYDSSFLKRLPLDEIIKGKAGVGTFVLSSPNVSETDQLVAAVSSEFRLGAVVIFMNYQKVNFFNRRIGIGYMIRNIGNQPGIEYIFLQGKDGVMLSSRELQPVLAISSDTFLQEVLDSNREESRRLMFEGSEVLEIARPFTTRDLPPGVLRVGLSLAGYHQVARNFKTQMAILGVILFLLTFLFVTIVVANQNYRSVAVAYEQFKNITSNILGGIESAIVAVDSSGRVLIVNPKTERFFGYKGAEIIGKPYGEIFEEDSFLIEELDKSTEDSVLKEITFVDKHGREHVLLATASRLLDQRGNFQGMVGIAYDITERKSLEAQAKRAERLSELGTLAAGVAHEIRNPLNAISIASQRLKSEFKATEDQPGFEKLATTIKTEIERLNSIIAEFLALARSGHLHKEKVNLKGFIEEAMGLLRNEAAQSNIEIRTEIDEGLELEIDSSEMKKVIVNLIRNAMESIGSDGEISIIGQKKAGKAVIIVQDTGKGIDPIKINEIFTPYYTTKQNGTGLGLSISHRIVMDHQGNISAENVKPHGARFKIELPLT